MTVTETALYTSATTRALFEPWSLKSLNLSNRVVMAPMTRSMSPEGVPGADVADYYRRRAENGVGLIITEGTTIDHRGASQDPRTPCFHGEAALAGWQKIVTDVHEVGGRIMPQIWHVGLIKPTDFSGIFDSGDLPATHVGPSGLAGGIGLKPYPARDPMTEQDIADIIDAFGSAAATAWKMGFDGVEIHAAHGYLIDQFFWSETNLRGAPYGGGVTERSKFGADVVRAIRDRVPADFPVCMRISQWKQHDYNAKTVYDVPDMAAWLGPLVDAGVDLFHCSQRRFWEPEFDGSPLNLAGWVKKLSGRPTIAVGSVSLGQELFDPNGTSDVASSNIDLVAEMIARGEFDLIAIGRALVSNPDWVRLVQSGRAAELKAYESSILAELY